MRVGAVAALLAAATVLTVGCGERDFNAGEFIDAANAQGAALALGEEITTTESGEPVYTVKSSPDRSGDPNPQLEGGRASGTLIVADDVGAASAEFDHCETAADLTCFRAANIVLRFEELPAADQARISGAVSALASDG